MITENGEALLQAYATRTFQKKCVKISDRLYYFSGYGHSNATLLIGNESCILIDALNALPPAIEVREAIRKITEKPVKTIIYTHGHPDHRGGAGAFADTVKDIYAFAPMVPVLKHSGVVFPILMNRGAHQFGYELTDEELITQGLGPREAGEHGMLPPTVVFTEKESVHLEIDGVALDLIPAVGETDDQIFVWIAEEQALCCGDNFYPCFPNLYAIRGGQYRDVSAWVDSLTEMIAYPTLHLLPGHGFIVQGHETITEILTNYRDAIQSVLMQTLEGMNAGKTIDELAGCVHLPKHLCNLPYLGEHYGAVEWSVRSIFNGYAGWFDGNPTNLHRLSPDKESAHMIMALGGVESVKNMISCALENNNAEDAQWALQLCDYILNHDDDGAKEFAKEQKAKACLQMAKWETSSNGRHYYQTTAKDLLK